MAQKNTGKTHFKPGNPGGGRKPLPPDILAAKAEKQETFLRWVIEIMDLKMSDLGESKEQIALAINEMPLGKRPVARWFMSSDIRGIEYCHNRLWGKIPDDVRLSDQDGRDLIPKPYDLSKLTKDELRAWLKLLEKTQLQSPK